MSVTLMVPAKSGIFVLPHYWPVHIKQRNIKREFLDFPGRGLNPISLPLLAQQNIQPFSNHVWDLNFFSNYVRSEFILTLFNSH